MVLLMEIRNIFRLDGVCHKIGMVFLFSLLISFSCIFSSCSFYENLCENPVYKYEVISPPENFYSITSSDKYNADCVTLVWELVQGAVAYELYWSDERNSGSVNKIYLYEVEYEQNKQVKLEVSNLCRRYNYFYICSVNSSGAKSKLCNKAVEIFSSNNNSYWKNFEFRKL